MSQFNTWFAKILGAKETETDLVDEYLNTKKIESFASYDTYNDKSEKIDRSDLIININNKINKYDEKKKQNNKKYKTYHEGFKNEVDKQDENKILDKSLDIILNKKLDIDHTDFMDNSEKSKKELESQEEIYKKRESDRLDQTKSLRNKLKVYDDIKKKEDSKYITFEDICLENEWNEVDYEMKINLEEKLGVYDESKEKDEIKNKRLEKQKKIDDILDKYIKNKQNKFNQ